LESQVWAFSHSASACEPANAMDEPHRMVKRTVAHRNERRFAIGSSLPTAGSHPCAGGGAASVRRRRVDVERTSGAPPCVDEAMRGPRWHDRQLACPHMASLPVDLSLELTLQKVEELVLTGVHAHSGTARLAGREIHDRHLRPVRRVQYFPKTILCP